MIGHLKTRRALVVLFFAMLPASVVADCKIYTLPSICDPVAQDSQHWIGEYAGQSTSFSMTMNGKPFRPDFQETGTMTLFEMSGALGFVGGGGFNGTAELTDVTAAPTDVQFFTGDWAWLADEIETIVFLQTQHVLDTDDPGACPIRWWPRWKGTYQPPNSPVMQITLLATTFDQMFGRVFYSGQQGGAQVRIDSRFTMTNLGFDPTGYSTELHSDESQQCQTHCKPGSQTLLCAD
jgi:hypothetical protein